LLAVHRRCNLDPTTGRREPMNGLLGMTRLLLETPLSEE
jgi:hypothetical protein